MNKNRKKGFTLVELLVVIAILAILAVVSVVGYTSFTKKAKIADDISLTTQLNTILQANEATDGANKYPHEAALELVDGGYDVTKITPTAEKYNYVYDLNQNRMFLLDESYNVVSPSDLTLSDDKASVFGFAGSQDEVTEFNNHGYSVYLKSTYNSDSVTTCAGVDVGDNENVNVSLVSSTKTVSNSIKSNSLKRTKIDTATNSTQGSYVIRTNGGTLTINNSEAVVSHFGVSTKIEITAVATHSEYGEVEGNIEIKVGELSLESSSNVNTILVTCESTNTVSINVSSKATIGTVAPATDAAKEVVAKSTSIPTESKVETVVTKTDDFTGGLGTEKSPYVITSGLEFNNIFENYENQMINGNYLYFSQKGNIEITTSHNDFYFNGSYNGNGYDISASNDLESGVYYLFGVSKVNADIKNLNVYSTKTAGFSLLGYSVQGKTVTKYLNGSCSFENVNTYVKNDETFETSVANFGFFIVGAIFSRVETDGKKSVVQISVTFKDCNNYASVTSLTRCAAFVGAYDGLDEGAHAKLSMTNCNNYGNITCEGVDEVGVICANSYESTFKIDGQVPSEEVAKQWVNLVNVKNYGNIKAVTARAFAMTYDNFILNSLYQDNIGGNYISASRDLSGINAPLYYDNGTFKINGSSSDYTYKVMIQLGEIYKKDVDVAMSSRALSVDDVVSGNTGTKISAVYAYDFNNAKTRGIVDDNTSLNFKYTCDSFKVALVVKDSSIYVIFSNDDVDHVGKTEASESNKVNLYVRVYNKSNEWIGNIKLA